MEIEARHVRRRQLSQYLDKDLLQRERRNNEPTLSSLLAAKKRLSTEMNRSGSNAKKARTSSGETVSVIQKKVCNSLSVWS